MWTRCCGLDVIITFLNYGIKNLIVIQKAHSNKPTYFGDVDRVTVDYNCTVITCKWSFQLSHFNGSVPDAEALLGYTGN